MFGKGCRENVREVDRECFGRRECVEKGSRDFIWKMNRHAHDPAHDNLSQKARIPQSEEQLQL